MFDAKRNKRIKKRPKSGYISKAVREFYPDLRDVKSTEKKFVSAVKLAERAYKASLEPIELTEEESKHRFRARGAGRKTNALPVREALFQWFIGK